uniref:Uncharacterized protein n=1 Tax=viral metagenome TaxID=1070528 RepID=A0A6C0BLG7_9ZZZZ
MQLTSYDLQRVSNMSRCTQCHSHTIAPSY